MKDYTENPFIFSPRYRIVRHLAFWTVHILVFSFLYKVPGQSWWVQHAGSAIAAVAFVLYSYPIMYVFVPRFLLKGRLPQFVAALLLWGIAGYFFNYVFRKYVFFPLTSLLNTKKSSLAYSNSNAWAPAGYIIMNLMAGYGSMIVLFKYWVKKQKDFMYAEKEKINAELQLLKAQVHPHFLFNTLNNIYSFSMENSPKTPQLVLKLSSLLSYILYDCKSDEVQLEKEIETMKNYIDLEKERYGNKLEVSLNFEGDIKDNWIAPLLLLPFLENAFKHGTSDQLEKPWLSVDVSVKQNMLHCKIVNSKDDPGSDRGMSPNMNGIGIQNVKKRLAYLYPDRSDLKLNDEGSFFVVSLMLELSRHAHVESEPVSSRRLEKVSI